MNTAFRHILISTDFSDASRSAMRLATDLATQVRGKLTILHVCDVSSYAYASVGHTSVDLLTAVEEAAQEQLSRTVLEVQKTIPEVRSILRLGIPWTEILAAVDEQHVDLVIMGTHGRRGLGRLLLGSVAEKVVRASPVPVLTVRGTAREDSSTEAA